MIFEPTSIDGLLAIELKPQHDERGFFARTYCEEEFRRRGLITRWVQCNLSHSDRRGTVRGIHYQAAPEPDGKLIRVARGSVFGAAVDLRREKNFGRTWSGVVSAEACTMVYVPVGCAFGFQTLADDTDVLYQMSAFYRPELARGIRWDDSDLGFDWPLPVSAISPRDRNLPRLRELNPACV